MRRLFLCLVVLSACSASAVPVYLNPGVTAQLALQDEALCREQARRAVPERRRVTTSPRITVGVGKCTGNVCVGVNSGREIYDFDENNGLRGEAVGACMGAKGYQLVSLPACSGPSRPLTSHPFDTTGLCVANGAIAAPVN